MNTWKLDEDLGIASHEDVIIGIHFPNGVFDENAKNYGISYILDHVLYCALIATIEDEGRGTVRCITNYGYTSFLIATKAHMIVDNLHCAEEILLHNTLNYDTQMICDWIKFRKQYHMKLQKDADILYYYNRIPDTALAYTLSERLYYSPTASELETWRNRYIQNDKLYVLISGDDVHLEIRKKVLETNQCYLPQFRAQPTVPPKHIPWRYSKMLLSYSLSFSEENILAAEALCRILKPIISANLNQMQGKIVAVEIHPDYIPELQISLHCPRGTEAKFITRIHDVICSVSTEKIAASITKARLDIQQYYQKLRQDSEEWNLFAGYNAISGNRYTLLRLMCREEYQDRITISAVSSLLAEIKREDYCVFVTAVR